ncbi:glycosyltransferase [Spirosoma gilvum]
MLDTNQLSPVRPSVSILIAARNEEFSILNCLKAIAELDTPDSVVEVLIGNDQSTDRTDAVVADFVRKHPSFQLIPITESDSGLQGKTNALAQLANQARGQYLFFTDADTQVPTTWVSEMGRYLVGKTGIVTGVTLPDGPKLIHKLQALDWLYNLTLAHWLGSVGIPVTALGNNMAVSRQAYEAVGGYESLPFSVTEDFALFQAVVNRGYGFHNLVNEQVLARTLPVDTLQGWLQQRKRWMHGAMRLPRWMVLFLYGQYLIGPLLVLLAWVTPVSAVALYSCRLLIQTMVLSYGLSRLRQTKLWPYALLFEIYQLIMGPLAVIYYWLPTKIDWKGRKY